MRLLILRTCGGKKVHSKAAASFKKFSKLTNLTIRRGGKSEIIFSSSCGTNENQNQKQIKPKQEKVKLKPK